MTETGSLRVTGLVVGKKRNGRCVYSAQGKRALVEGCHRPGVSVARTALEHGVNANLLRKWIHAYRAERAAGSVGLAAKAVKLLPVTSVEPSVAERVAPGRSGEALVPWYIEIVLAQASVRLYGRVDVGQLREVIDCLGLRA